ncbi:glycine cleavage system H protein [Streptomyces collinus]|uniref:glycine cleavage system H protein n=1 Tax=Streptomyces collinus TaxID=42684 RepID=UPI00382581FC
MSNIPDSLMFTANHTWVRDEGGFVTVGLTDYIVQDLSDVVLVKVPEEGRTVRVGETICVVESTEATHEVYSPFSGEVIGANVSLEAYADWVNHSPYDQGWLFRIKPMDGAPTLNLLAAAEYERLVG